MLLRPCQERRYMLLRPRQVGPTHQRCVHCNATPAAPVHFHTRYVVPCRPTTSRLLNLFAFKEISRRFSPWNTGTCTRYTCSSCTWDTTQAFNLPCTYVYVQGVRVYEVRTVVFAKQNTNARRVSLRSLQRRDLKDSLYAEFEVSDSFSRVAANSSWFGFVSTKVLDIKVVGTWSLSYTEMPFPS